MAKITDLAIADTIDGTELLPIVKGGQTRRTTLTALRALIVPFLQQWYKGDPGPAGPAGNVAASLAALRAAPITNGMMLFRRAAWTWDETAVANGRDAIASDHSTTGAWVLPTAADMTVRGPGLGGGIRPLLSKAHDWVSVKDFGTIGDGAVHPLSERYATLAAAKVDYPFATSLKQTLDYCGIQAALNWASENPYTRRGVRVPNGYYVIYGGQNDEPIASLGLPSWVTVEGESRHGTVFNQQGIAFPAPIFVNQDPTALTTTTLRKFTALGGTHLLKIAVTEEQAGMVVDNITTALQTVGQIETNKLQTTVFRDCDFVDGVFAIKADGIVNANRVDNCRLTVHTGTILSLKGIVGQFLMTGGSMEAGGNSTSIALDIDGGDAIAFHGVYFENVHKKLLRSRNSQGIDFDACRFIGVDLGFGMEAFTFDTASDLISFGNNYWFVNPDYPDVPRTTAGPTNMLIRGHNDNLVGKDSAVWTARSGRKGAVTSRRRAFTDTITFDALRFTRPNNRAFNSLSGTLRVTMQGSTAAGLPAVKIANFIIAAKGIPDGALVASYQVGTQLDDNTGFFIQLQETNQSGIGTTLQLAVYGANAAGLSVVSSTFDYSTDTSDDANNIGVSLP